MREKLIGLAAAVAATLVFGASPAAAQNEIHHYPQVDAAPSGAAVVVWETSVDGDRIIRARRRAPSGALGPTHTVSAPGSTFNLDPRVAMDGNGNATFMWRNMACVCASATIQTRRLSSAGALGPITDLSPVSTAHHPDLAVSANGVATFAWQAYDTELGKNVIKVRQRVGTYAPRPAKIAGEHYGDSLQVATDPTGNATIAWTQWDSWFEALTTRRLSSAGAFNAPIRLTEGAASAFGPEVAVAPSGRATFAWSQSDTKNQIIQTRWRDPNGTVGPVKKLSAAGRDAFLPQLAVDQDGDATFVWQRSDGTNDLAQTRTLAGDVLSTTQTLSAAGQSVSKPKVDVSPDGNARFVWNRFNGSLDDVIQSRRRTAAGALTATATLSTTGSDSIEQQVAVDANGNSFLAWTRQGNIYDPSNPSHVQLRKISATGTIGPTQNLE